MAGIGGALAMRPHGISLPALQPRVSIRMEVAQTSQLREDQSATVAGVNIDELDLQQDDVQDVICARGVCVVPDEAVAPEVCELNDDGTVECIPNPEAPQPGLSFEYLWPRGLLLFSSVLYGTNFPLGRIMNEALPPSAATSARMLFAALALSPFLLQLSPSLRKTGLLCGCFTALVGHH